MELRKYSSLQALARKWDRMSSGHLNGALGPDDHPIDDGRAGMALAITGERLWQAIRNETFVKGGDVSCVEGVKYDFRLGTRVLKASIGQPTGILDIPEPKRVIEPGEIVFVLTEERLELPRTILAELSPKRKLSHDGILVLGGFCVDPLYRGKLLVGLYNFSSTPWPLRAGKKLIAAIFYELQATEVVEGVVGGEKVREPEGIENFPDELVRMIGSYKPIVLQGLQDDISELRRQLSELHNTITSDREWQRQFQASLGRHDDQIGNLLRGLETEQETRKKGEDTITDALRKIEGTLSWLRGAAWTVGVLLGMIVVPFLVNFFANWLTKK